MIPRWTVYPALALLIGMPMAVIGLKQPKDPYAGMAKAALANSNSVLPPAEFPRMVVLGIDGLDPEILTEAIERYPDRTRNFQWLASGSGIHSLGTSTPPQSPVAWSNFITGLNPGGHGIFDFLHRSTESRGVIGSTMTDVHPPMPFFELGDWMMPDPFADQPEPNRTGTPFWVRMAEAGVPADLWRMPINFPVDASHGVSFPGMMTPALDSAYGESTFFTDDPLAKSTINYKKLVVVSEFGGKIDTSIIGPPNSLKIDRSVKVHEGSPPANVISRCALRFFVDRENGTVAIDSGDGISVLRVGEWGDFIPLTFDMGLPTGFMNQTGMARFYLRSLEPNFELYASPVNIDPEAPASPVSEPDTASADLAGEIGSYYTQGMAEDVNSLKKDLLSVEEFMQQVEIVYDERRQMMDYAIDRYLERGDGGLMFFYYSTVDLTSHMMWRHGDTEHPDHDPEIAARSSERWTDRPGSTWKDTTFDAILKIDPVLGRLRERLGDDVTYIVMSDHGFAPYRRVFSLNTWLVENGYLVLKPGRTKELAKSDPNYAKVGFSAVDWTKTKAYGIGFNGLYLNLKGREKDIPTSKDVDENGIVSLGAEADSLLAEIKEKLEAVIDPVTNLPVVLTADLASEIYSGTRMAEAPDILVGYNYGYGNADASSTGRIPHETLRDNLGGTFNGSHLMAPEVVAGTLISNRPVRQGSHKLEDMTVQILHHYGIDVPKELTGHPVLVD